MESVSQRRANSYGFICTWNLRNKTDEQRKRERQRERDRDRGKPRNRFLTIETKLMVTGGDAVRGMGEIGDRH